MRVELFNDRRHGPAVLTTGLERTAMGAPLLKYAGTYYGPRDELETGPLAGSPAAYLVLVIVLGAGSTADQRVAAEAFLRQWAGGPQLEPARSLVMRARSQRGVVA